MSHWHIYIWIGLFWGFFPNFLEGVYVSTVHGQTVENNSLTAYDCLSWTMDILVHQRFVNILSTVSH